MPLRSSLAKIQYFNGWSIAIDILLLHWIIRCYFALIETDHPLLNIDINWRNVLGQFLPINLGPILRCNPKSPLEASFFPIHTSLLWSSPTVPVCNLHGTYTHRRVPRQSPTAGWPATPTISPCPDIYPITRPPNTTGSPSPTPGPT